MNATIIMWKIRLVLILFHFHDQIFFEMFSSTNTVKKLSLLPRLSLKIEFGAKVKHGLILFLVCLFTSGSDLNYIKAQLPFRLFFYGV